MRVVAHRTCPLHAPENSLAGIRVASELGADGVEVDVRLTRDGIPVLGHDRTAWRTARWPVPIRFTSSRRFQRLHRRRHPAPLPTLAAALEALPPGLGLALDLKDDAALGPALALLEERGRLPGDGTAAEAEAVPVGLWSRNPARVAEAARLAPGCERTLLRGTTTPAATRDYLADAARCGATAVSLDLAALSREAVQEARRLGLTAYCWVTVLDQHRRVLELGVDGVVTDWPDVARRLAAERSGG